MGWKILGCFLAFQIVWADVSPASLTFFGLYGTPVQPQGLASSTVDGLGLNVLGEYNASEYASVGFSYERAAFYGNQGFYFQTANLESRFFPFRNEKQKFSPYVYGGAGLGLNNTNEFQLKTGIGSRVAISGPIFFDLAVGSHWFQSAVNFQQGNFQFVDLRAGLSCSIGFKEEVTPSPTPTPTVLAVTPTPMPTSTETTLLLTEPSPTPTPVISQAPVTTVEQSKLYYTIGMNAFKAENYALAFHALKVSLSLKEKHKHPYKYAETYATLGVIYQFHAHSVKNHLQKALDNYRKALKIDPTTHSAKIHYYKLKKQLSHKSRPKPKPTPTPSGDTSQPGSQ